MPITRSFSNLTQGQVDTVSTIFTADGASARAVDEEGAFRLTVIYPEPWDEIDDPSSNEKVAPSDPWLALIHAYAADTSYSNAMKIATLSQWILESNRGQSDLARQHTNFGGLKYRDRMAGFATAIKYKASDGEDTYCKFASASDFIKGYWRFISSGPYAGYEKYRDDAAAYIRHIAPSYAGDAKYVGKVLALFSEADSLLSAAGLKAGESIKASQSQKKLAVVVGHNQKSPGAFAVLPINKSEFDLNNEVADEMEAEAAHYNLSVKRFNRTASSGYTEEIQTVYRAVEEWGADIAIELHFNSLNAKSTGTEVLYATGSKPGAALSLSLVKSIADLLDLPIRRGDGLLPCSKGDRGYSSLVAIQAPTVLVEPFFGSNPNDCVAAANVGPGGLARAYLRGVRDWTSVAD